MSEYNYFNKTVKPREEVRTEKQEKLDGIKAGKTAGPANVKATGAVGSSKNAFHNGSFNASETAFAAQADAADVATEKAKFTTQILTQSIAASTGKTWPAEGTITKGALTTFGLTGLPTISNGVTATYKLAIQTGTAGQAIASGDAATVEVTLKKNFATDSETIAIAITA